MKLVITGATGAIGQALLQRITQQNLNASDPLLIHALCSSDMGAASLKKQFPAIRVTRHVAWQSLDTALSGADVLVHMAWSSVPTTAALDPVKDMLANVEQAKALLDQAAASGVARVVFLSSGGTVYGPVGDQAPITEDHLPAPSTAYGGSKLAFERLLSIHALDKGYGALVLRPSNVYGMSISDSRPQGVVHHWMKAILEGRPIELWNEGSTVRDLVHIDDMVEALLLAIRYQGPNEILNVGTGVGTSLAQLVHAMEEMVGRPMDIVSRTGPAGAVGRNVLSTARAKEMIGFEARVTVAEGLRRSWQAIQSGASRREP